MPAAGRHAKPRKSASRLRAPVVVPVAAVATLTSVVAAFVSMHGGSAVPKPAHRTLPATAAEASFTGDRVTTVVRTDVAAGKARAARRVTLRHLAQQHAAQQAAPPAVSPAPSAAAPPPVSGGDAAQSALGICIRNAEEGGSYAWGPGNGGGAYQFSLGTWEAYGGAASEFGVAGPAYQDQIFDNAIAAGGASNWTAYDGC
jgi:Transglycosylase-like domain